MVVGMMFWPMPMVMVMPIVGAVRVRAVREPPHAHQAKRLFGLVNGLQLHLFPPLPNQHRRRIKAVKTIKTGQNSLA